MRVVVVTVTVSILHALIWFLDHKSINPPDSETTFQSLSFAPYDKNQNPNNNDIPTADQIDRDLARISSYTKAVRTYTTTGGPELVPELAFKYGLTVSLGAWVDSDEKRSQHEIDTAIELARTYRNIRSVLIGNEMLYRGNRTVEDTIKLIRRVKKRVKVPVSTGEIWNIWLENPRLVNEVDFIAAHILPYWEGIPASQAVAYALNRLDELRRTYPGKRIVIAEFGWPSNGANKFGAKADQVLQGQVIREFLTEIRRRGIEYNIVEAFDQPWKDFEGHGVGPYWGIFNANREIKFPLTGLVEDSTDRYLSIASLIIGLIFTVIGLVQRNVTPGQAFLYATAANVLGVGVVLAAAYPFLHYMNLGVWFMWGVGNLMLLPLVIINLAKVHEMARVILGLRPRRLITLLNQRPTMSRLPKVSIHIPACREQPEVLKATLNAVAALEYPSFEVLVILNNTLEEYYWRPIAEYCSLLGNGFKFIYLPVVHGFKAGAMNTALPFMADDAEIIAILDADYVVHSNWLKDLVPYFSDSNVAFIQAPQDHRDGYDNCLKRMMKREYDGFFDIGMVQRNEENAIIAHGTMLMVRRSAFERVGGWATDTIVEDSELGLRLLEAGYIAHYTNTRYGWGLLPSSYEAFQIQRHRWAYGAVQIFKKHCSHMLPWVVSLSRAQRVHYLVGWSYWLSDALGTLMALLNLIWIPMILLVGLATPPPALTIPLIVTFVINVIHNISLYQVRVKSSLLDTVGAAVTAMSLQLTIARAVYDGFIKGAAVPFRRTEKGRNVITKSSCVTTLQERKSNSPVISESVIGLLLLISALLIRIVNAERDINLDIFAVALSVQATPFLAATVMRVIERAGEAVDPTSQYTIPQLTYLRCGEKQSTKT